MEKLFKKYKHELFVFLLSFIIGATGIVYYGKPEMTIYGDASYYWSGINVINENFLNLIFSTKIGIVESLNVIILGILSYIPVNKFVLIYFIQIVLYSLTAVIVFKFSLDFINFKGAIFVLLFYLINYKHINHIFILKPGVWINFLLAFSIYSAYKCYKNPSILKYWIIFAISSGFLFLQDMRYIPHIGILVLTISTKVKPYYKNIKSFAAYLFIVMLIISPWIIRQSIVFHRFIFISDIHTITINKAFQTNYYKSLGEKFKKFEYLSDDEFKNNFYALCDSLKMSPAELIYARERLMYDKARTDTVNNQHENLISQGILSREEVKKLVEEGENKSEFRQYLEYGFGIWFPLNIGYRYEPMTVNKVIIEPISKPNLLITVITISIFLPLMLFGLINFIKTRNYFGIALILLFILHTLIHTFTYAAPRYMLPLLPYITAVGFYGILEIKFLYDRVFNLNK